MLSAAAEAFASQADTDSNAVIYDYDADYVDRKYELLSLKVIHRRRRTGFEETKDFPIRVNDLVAGRYQVLLCAAVWGLAHVTIPAVTRNLDLLLAYVWLAHVWLAHVWHGCKGLSLHPFAAAEHQGMQLLISTKFVAGDGFPGVCSLQ